MELDEWATKCVEAMNKMKQYEKQAKKYRTRIKKWMTENERRDATTLHWKIRRSIFTKSSMTKKETPPDVWKTYATARQQESLFIRPKK